MYFELIPHAGENLFSFVPAVKIWAPFSSFVNSVQSLCPSYQRDNSTRTRPIFGGNICWVFDRYQAPVVLSVINIRVINSEIKFSTSLTDSSEQRSYSSQTTEKKKY